MTDWIEGYKLGFKEGVIALKTQLTNNAQYGFSMGVGFFTIEADALDEICEELEGEK